MWYDALKDLLFNRYPIRPSLHIDNLGKPTIAVLISNQTPSLSVIVRSVRIHYGNFYSTRALVLYPQSAVTLPPKEEAKWILSFEVSKIGIQERTHRKTPILNPNQNAQPGIESPAQLFNAIGMGNAKDSWIEVDFNEYKQRCFLKGKVKKMFDIVGKQLQALRKQQ